MAGRILLLLIVVAGALQSGTPASYFDPYGFLFVLIGGVALVMISFPGAEIGRQGLSGQRLGRGRSDRLGAHRSGGQMLL